MTIDRAEGSEVSLCTQQLDTAPYVYCAALTVPAPNRSYRVNEKGWASEEGRATVGCVEAAGRWLCSKFTGTRVVVQQTYRHQGGSVQRGCGMGLPPSALGPLPLLSTTKFLGVGTKPLGLAGQPWLMARNYRSTCWPRHRADRQRGNYSKCSEGAKWSEGQ
jgi:hypothetical protein